MNLFVGGYGTVFEEQCEQFELSEAARNKKLLPT